MIRLPLVKMYTSSVVLFRIREEVQIDIETPTLGTLLYLPSIPWRKVRMDKKDSKLINSFIYLTNGS